MKIIIFSFYFFLETLSVGNFAVAGGSGGMGGGFDKYANNPEFIEALGGAKSLDELDLDHIKSIVGKTIAAYPHSTTLPEEHIALLGIAFTATLYKNNLSRNDKIAVGQMWAFFIARNNFAYTKIDEISCINSFVEGDEKSVIEKACGFAQFNIQLLEK